MLVVCSLLKATLSVRLRGRKLERASRRKQTEDETDDGGVDKDAVRSRLS